MNIIKAFISIFLYVISFVTVGISGEVKLSAELKETSGGRQYISFAYENETNKPIYGPARIKKLEMKTESGNVDVTDSLEIYNPEYAVTIYPHRSETQAGAAVKKPLQIGTYTLTIEYETTETFGNKGRVTKTVSCDFEV